MYPWICLSQEKPAAEGVLADAPACLTAAGGHSNHLRHWIHEFTEEKAMRTIKNNTPPPWGSLRLLDDGRLCWGGVTVWLSYPSPWQPLLASPWIPKTGLRATQAFGLTQQGCSHNLTTLPDSWLWHLTGGGLEGGWCDARAWGEIWGPTFQANKQKLEQEN